MRWLFLLMPFLASGQSVVDGVYHVYYAPASKVQISSPVHSFHELGDILFACNAGMFEADKSPVGLLIEDWKLTSPLAFTAKGNFGGFPFQGMESGHGVFSIDPDGARVTPTDAFIRLGLKPRIATQSGPILLYQGEINHHFTYGSPNKRIRNGVGVIGNDLVVFVISKEPVNFYEFAEYFRKLGCYEALYLDGGISQNFQPPHSYDSGQGLGPVIYVR